MDDFDLQVSCEEYYEEDINWTDVNIKEVTVDGVPLDGYYLDNLIADLSD